MNQLVGPGKRIAVIFNPTAGRRRRRRLEQVLYQLGQTGAEILRWETRARGDAERIARAAVEVSSPADRVHLIVVAGGDGTIGEVVNGLLTVPDAERRPPLALAPMGTANVLATEIGLSRSPRAIAATICEGIPVDIQVGIINGRCFTMMIGAGFDAEAVATVDLDLKRRIGWLAYVAATTKVALRYGSPVYGVDIDGQSFEASSVIVSNGRFYGGPFLVAPDARLARPEFQVCLFEKGGMWHSMRYGLALLLGVLPRAAGYRIVAGKKVTIDRPAGAAVQGDGDLIGSVPARIEMAATPLKLLVPPSSVGRIV